MAKYLDETGLAELWELVKQLASQGGIVLDPTPTDGSTNGVTSGGVYTALSGKSDTGHEHAAGDVTSGTFAAARIPDLAASKITSGALALARGGTASDNTARAINTVFAGPSSGSAGNASWRKLAAADLPTVTIAKGGTGKTTAAEARVALAAAAASWTQVATTTGTTAKTFDNLSTDGYKELLVTCIYSTTYQGAVVLPVARLSTTTREVYLTGAGSGSSTGRRCCCKLSLTGITPLQIWLDNSYVNGTWHVYAR